jgi:hypothetical protein
MTACGLIFAISRLVLIVHDLLSTSGFLAKISDLVIVITYEDIAITNPLIRTSALVVRMRKWLSVGIE